MPQTRGYCLYTPRLVNIFLWMILALFLGACINLGVTTFVKVPATKIPSPDERVLELMAPSCLDTERIKKLLKNDEELGALNVTYKEDTKRDELLKVIESVLSAENVICPQQAKKHWDTVRDDLVKDNQGLIADQGSSTDEFQRILGSAVNQWDQVSVSINAPGSLSLSTRPLPADQEPGPVFAGLKERAQAAVIGYAQAYVQPGDNKSADKKKSPEDAANALLKALSPTREPRIAETQRVEFTISAAVNSASVDDRFEYITAYLKLPTLPGRLNARVSLERIFLVRFQGLMFARPEYQRIACELEDRNSKRRCVEKQTWEHLVKADLRRALDSIRVRIEVIDPLDTKAATVELGKLTSQAGLGLEAAQTVIGELSLTRISPSISAGREDSLKRELDKRTAWISPERSLLRITQRGLREATISGTISSALTLKIPKTNFYVLTVVEEDAPKKNNDAPAKKGKQADKAKSTYTKGKIKKVKLDDAEQPLYGVVDALGIALGTVRVAVPSTYPFRKELDGVSTTVIGNPVVLRLWRHDREVIGLEFQDMVPQLRGKLDGARAIGISSELPYARQFAVFRELKQWATFMQGLTSEKLRLREHPQKPGWFLIAGGDICEIRIGQPGTDEVLLGIENEEGVVEAFNADQSKHLSRFIAKC